MSAKLQFVVNPIPAISLRQTEVCRTSARDFFIHAVASINQEIVAPIAYSTLAVEVIKDLYPVGNWCKSNPSNGFSGRNVGKIISIAG